MNDFHSRIWRKRGSLTLDDLKAYVRHEVRERNKLLAEQEADARARLRQERTLASNHVPASLIVVGNTIRMVSTADL